MEDNDYFDNNFLILDDNIGDIVTEFRLEHIIHTDFNYGFNEEKLREALTKIKSLEDKEQER